MLLLPNKTKYFRLHKLAGKALLTSQKNINLSLRRINCMSSDIGGVK